MILESNEEIDNLVNFLDSKVILLRTKYPKSKLLVKIKNVYDTIIVPWREKHQLEGKILDIETDEFIKNSILDLANNINNILIRLDNQNFKNKILSKKSKQLVKKIKEQAKLEFGV